jgi:zeaxanthin glucosyltransferase
MASVALLPSPARGHFNGTLHLAKSLRSRGHNVRYCGIEDCRSFVEDQGLPFDAVLGDVLPRGLYESVAREQRSARGLERVRSARRLAKLAQRALDALSRELPLLFHRHSVELVLLDSFLADVALAVRGATLPRLVMLSTTLSVQPDDVAPPITSDAMPAAGPLGRLRTRLLWARIALGDARRRATLSVLTVGARDRPRPDHGARRAAAFGVPTRVACGAFGRTLVDVPELVLCPREFDLPRRDSSRILYGDPGVDLARHATLGDVLSGLDDRPLVYCSTGTLWDATVPVVQRLLSAVIESFCRRGDLQLIVTTGARVDRARFGALPPHIRVVPFAPQLDVLRQASAMITHGGLNTVKECILLGVPMIVFPLGSDQRGNAVRVQRHGLGLRGCAQRATADVVGAKVDAILRDPGFRGRVAAMQTLFRSSLDRDQSARLIEAVLGISSPQGR